MKCPTCGAEVQPGQKYCPSCGTQQKADQAWGYAPSVRVEDRGISKTQFCRNYAPDKIRKNIRGSAILRYFSAAITGVVAVLMNPFMLIDAVIVLALGLAIHLKQSRVCAVLLLAYGVINCLIMLVGTGRLSGWLIILAGVFAVIYTFQLEKEYRAFQESGGPVA